ncbi:solute carrier family 28 member 3-like [Oppia nitens]|uniref:solute carrier family 28 member 3-like n=1 Tax=Oppia nitens TaxID=1686743 RepID=UPI0023DCE74B|nr:solute carrier family 28 member 3-like [Oppia nitens]
MVFNNEFVRQLCETIKKYKKWLLLLLLLAYNVYMIFAIYLTWNKQIDCANCTAGAYCYGVKLLVVLTSIAYLIGLYYTVLKRLVVRPVYRHIIRPIAKTRGTCLLVRHASKIVWSVAIAGALVFIVWDSLSTEPLRLASGGGLLAYILIGYMFSKHRSHVQWRQLLWGIYMQFLFGLMILRWEFGKQVFQCMGDKVSAFLEFTDAGSSFVFGYLVTGHLDGNVTLADAGGTSITGSLPIQAAVFAFKVMPVVIFFSFFVSILFYYGIMQILVVKIGWLLESTIGTTACESLNASGNIFLGMTEAPLMIKPYLPVMTKSELHAVMTGGFATIAGSVMAAYINFGVSASHLLSASVMSAPAALAYSKLIYPETEKSKTTNKTISVGQSTERNALEAGSNGAGAAIKLIANIVANLIAFLAFIQFLDVLISWFGSLVDYPELNFKLILSKIFIPFALLMGIEWHECDRVAKLIGLKTVINEFVAYQELSVMIKANELSKRAQIVATYALCGFSNFGSIGIMLGALGSMAPDRKPDLADLALRAMIAGSISCFMTACIAGLLISS